MRFVGALLLVMLAVALGSYLVFRVRPASPCHDRLLEQATSPDGRAVAARFERICAEGAAVSTQVGLRLAESAFSPREQDTVFIAAGRPAIEISWSDARTLLVESSARGLVKEEPAWRNVAVVIRRVR